MAIRRPKEKTGLSAEGTSDEFTRPVTERGLACAEGKPSPSNADQLLEDLERVSAEGDKTFAAYLQLRSDLKHLAHEVERMTSERDKVKSELEELRRVATRLLRSPFVPLGDNVRHKVSRGLSRVVAPLSPRAASKFERSAFKRSPKRYMNASVLSTKTSDNALRANNPSAGFPSKAEEAVVVLPFKRRLAPVMPVQKIAVLLHSYHVDQAETFRSYLQNISAPFDLYISTDTEEKAGILNNVFANGPARKTEIKLLPNRGRDIAPKLVGFAHLHDDYDLVLHIHSKKSLHDSRLEGWRSYILEALIGSREAVDSILDAFSVAPRLGMVAPPNFLPVRPHMNWGDNFDEAQKLATRIGFALTDDTQLDFPCGSMFWARPEALKPMLGIGLTETDFPEELGQLDGTVAHAIERLFFFSCEAAGLRWVHAGPLKNLSVADDPIRVESRSDLELAIMDRTPTLLPESDLA